MHLYVYVYIHLYIYVYADVNAAEHGGALAGYILEADARLRQRQEVRI